MDHYEESPDFHFHSESRQDKFGQEAAMDSPSNFSAAPEIEASEHSNHSESRSPTLVDSDHHFAQEEAPQDIPYEHSPSHKPSSPLQSDDFHGTESSPAGNHFEAKVTDLLMDDEHFDSNDVEPKNKSTEDWHPEAEPFNPEKDLPAEPESNQEEEDFEVKEEIVDAGESNYFEDKEEIAADVEEKVEAKPVEQLQQSPKSFESVNNFVESKSEEEKEGKLVEEPVEKLAWEPVQTIHSAAKMEAEIPPVPLHKEAATSSEGSKTRSIRSVKSDGVKFYSGGCFDLTHLSSNVVDLIYWRDQRKSGVVLGAVLAILISLTVASFISVMSYASLAVLTITLSFRLYKNILQAVQKTQLGHPFKEFLEVDVTVPAEKVHEVADLTAARLNGTLVELRRLFLVEDLVDSVKFGLALWVLTYVGSWFNGLTLVILGVVGLFSLPKVYETHQDKIDQNLDFVRGKINEVVEKVQAVVPIGKKPKAQ